MNKLIIYTDGASKGNPGKAGAGVVFKDEQGKIMGTLSWYLPKATNNQAEYFAASMALSLAHIIEYKLPLKLIEIRSDSMLMIKQLNHEWEISDSILKQGHNMIQRIINNISAKVSFVHISRTINTEADRLANKVIEDYEKGTF